MVFGGRKLGRIMVLIEPEMGKKNKVRFLASPPNRGLALETVGWSSLEILSGIYQKKFIKKFIKAEQYVVSRFSFLLTDFEKFYVLFFLGFRDSS
jgi:hypothetical protein